VLLEFSRNAGLHPFGKHEFMIQDIASKCNLLFALFPGSPSAKPAVDEGDGRKTRAFHIKHGGAASDHIGRR
jgi:hypothetical protein